MENELQNAYSMSQMEEMEEAVGRSRPIHEALERGEYVVVSYYPKFCSRTDAIMGQGRSFEASFKTLEEAEKHRENVVEINWNVDELSFGIITPDGEKL